MLAYLSDQPGAGGYCDSTWLLKGILGAGLGDVAYAFIYDPESAERCAAAGVGARIELELGGKVDPPSAPRLT